MREEADENMFLMFMETSEVFGEGFEQFGLESVLAGRKKCVCGGVEKHFHAVKNGTMQSVSENQSQSGRD